MPSGKLIPRADRTFGKFDLMAKLATGGMAEIYLGRSRDGPLGQLFVVKRVLPHLAEDERFVAMFRDEARLASKIHHENVCRVYEAGTVDHLHYLSMEYLHGVTLANLCQRYQILEIKSVDVRVVTAILHQCCAGLHHAHELRGPDGRSLEVVHRDVSPANVFISDDGVVKLLDFGVAKAHGATQRTSTGMVKGKNSYMSPEQILGHAIDRRSDVFSLGICLYEALTASRLFARDTDFLTFTAITDVDIPDIRVSRPDLPRAVVDVMYAALERDPANRPATAAEMADRLAEAMVPLGGLASLEEIAAAVQREFPHELAARQQILDTVRRELYSLDDRDDEGEFRVDTRLVQEELGERDAVSRPWLRVALGALIGMGAVVAVFLVWGVGNREPAAAAPSRTAATDTRAAASGRVAADAARAPARATIDAGVAEAAPIDAAAAKAAVTIDAGHIAPPVDRRPGFFSIDSRPYATIYANGRKLGVTPLFKAKLAPGPYRIRAESATGAVKTFRVTIRPNKTMSKGRLRWD